MALDYTKVFTMWGQYLVNVVDWYALMTELNNDQTDIENELSTQLLVRLADGLDQSFDGFRRDLSKWVKTFNRMIETVLTDEELVGAQFSLGANVNLTQLWPIMIHDMVVNDKNVTACVASIGAPGYTTANASVGKLVAGSKLDGVTPPMRGAIAIPDYAGLTTQLTPDSETLTFRCVRDSETGAQRGAEQFQITGTLARSDPYDPGGESVGNLGTIQVADSGASQYVSNPGFDTWGGSPEAASGWTVQTGSWGTDFVKSAVTLYGSGFSLRVNSTAVQLRQDLPATAIVRNRGYFITVWARKITDALADGFVTISILDDAMTYATFNAQPISTTWTHYSAQYVVPAEIVGTLRILLDGNVEDAVQDPVLLDQIVITPCVYHAGVAFAMFGGVEKWLKDDLVTVALSNNNAGLFQESARKAFKIQLPTDGTPTISDALVG